jgi:hypothetical protein
MRLLLTYVERALATFAQPTAGTVVTPASVGPSYPVAPRRARRR